MYVVTQTGHKIQVANPKTKEDEWCPFQQTVGLYDDNTILKDIWVFF